MFDKDDFDGLGEDNLSRMIQLLSSTLGIPSREYNFASAHYNYQILRDLPELDSGWVMELGP